MKFCVAVSLLIGILLQHCQAIVYNEDHYRDFRRKCSKILGTPTEVRQKIEDTKDYIHDDGQMQCLLQCFGMPTDDDTGAPEDLMAEQVGVKERIKECRHATNECVRALPQQKAQLYLCRKPYFTYRCIMESVIFIHLDKENKKECQQ